MAGGFKKYHLFVWGIETDSAPQACLLKLESGAYLNSAREVDLRAEYAKGRRAVQAKARESEIDVVEGVEEITRQYELVALGHRDILGDRKINIPLKRAAQLVEGNPAVLAQQGAMDGLVDRVGILEEVDAAGRSTYFVTSQHTGMRASAEAAQIIKALVRNRASTVAQEGAVVAVSRYAYRETGRERPDAGRSPPAGHAIQQRIVKTERPLLSEGQRVGPPSVDYVFPVEEFGGIVEVQVVGAV